jgi:pimeloyl-ACP methyl ester carboxylesterase
MNQPLSSCTARSPSHLQDGGPDLYTSQDRYHQQFAADVADNVAARMGVTQRPVTDGGHDPSQTRSTVEDIPSWFVYAELDRNIPVGAHALMAERARSRKTVEVSGVAHALPVSRPEGVPR